VHSLGAQLRYSDQRRRAHGGVGRESEAQGRHSHGFDLQHGDRTAHRGMVLRRKSRSRGCQFRVDREGVVIECGG
jgi:hypothetical protein